MFNCNFKELSIALISKLQIQGTSSCKYAPFRKTRQKIVNNLFRQMEFGS